MEKEEKKVLTFDGGVTEGKINEWKAKFRKVARIDVVDGEECHVGYFKRPPMEVMQAVAKIGKSNEVKSAETLFNGTWLGGSEYIKTDSVLFMECMKQLTTFFSSCMSSIKNL